MTELLEKALAELNKLPAADQDAVAVLILDQLADERRCDEAFGRSQAELGRLAELVRRDIQAGRVIDKGIDEL